MSPWSGKNVSRKGSTKQFIVLEASNPLFDKQLNSPVRSVPFSPFNGFTDMTAFNIGNTPRYDFPNGRGNPNEESMKENSPKGFTSKLQPYFVNSKRTVNKTSIGWGCGEFVPLTPQPEKPNSRRRADSSPDSIHKFLTPQLLSRHISHDSLVRGKETIYPGRTLASPVSKKLNRQDSDSILTEDSITFVRTKL